MVGMIRFTGAAVLGLMLLAGCKSVDFSSFVSLQSTNEGRERVVTGSLETVAESARANLTQMGLAAVVNRDGETIRVASTTPTGSRFTLVFKREMGKDGEQTRARIEWDGQSDDAMGFQLLGQLTAVSSH